MDPVATLRAVPILCARIVVVAGPVAWLLITASQQVPGGSTGGAIVSAVVLVLAGILADGIASALAVESSASDRVQVRSALMRVSDRLTALVTSNVLLFLVVLGLFVPTAAVLTIALSTGPLPPLNGAQAPSAAGNVVLAVGTALVVRVLTVRWALVTPMALYGSQGPMETLRFSWRATRGSVVRLFLVLGLIDVLGALIALATTTLGGQLATASDLVVIPLTSTAVACAWIALGRRVSPSHRSRRPHDTATGRGPRPTS